MVDKEDPQAPALQGGLDPPGPQDPPPPQNPQVPFIPNVPLAPPAPEAPHVPTPHVPILNWSHFKLEYSRKPDKDAGGNLLRTNNWMDKHRFQDHIKVQRFCLTLTGEARL